MAVKKLKDEYVRHATVLSITDGDTAVFSTDLGCEIFVTMKSRFSGINCPEKNTKEGKVAKAFLEKLMPVGSEVTIKTYKDEKEKYGRYLVVVFMPNNEISLNQQMIDAGHAVTYNGEKRT